MTRPRARRGGRSAPDEAGAATVLGVALAGLLLLLGVALAELGAVVVAHRRAQAAADLAALAGATSRADGCLAADRVALANGAALTACTPEGSAVLVTVRVDAPPGLDRVLVIEARARAGPAP
ncbi:MAG: Rv3654c family TadE-like protein [Nocardioides marinisabuli]|uniref:Rv3654c family TadE-like protein n=1 Tax=Nocardioides marinisabuli TaxID=419476 RepID=UPI0032195DFE